MPLPIDSVRPEFSACMDAGRRLVVTAETGAGKSTQVPCWLAERVAGLVLVVEPRRVACEALADHLARQRGERVGEYFGSRVRFADRSGPATRVLYCTPGVALRMLAEAEAPAALVVDEFHERSWQMDLVVAAAASLPRFADLPLVLTSATIDAEAAAEVLGAATLHARGRSHPVDISYRAEGIEPSTQDLGPRVAAAVEEALAAVEGDVLVFLPGMREIQACAAALGRRPEEVLTVHGSQPPEVMRRVFATPTRRRVYLATNVAETSITLPGVRVVIDSGLAKMRLHRAGRTVLATVPIAKASMEQRAGRAGRVAAGHCVRLFSPRFEAEPFQRPEVERSELDDLVLQAAELGLHGAAFDAATWISPPPAFAVERARTRLQGLAALQGEVPTERGHRLARLPVSAEEASLLVGAPAGIDGTLCDLVAVLQARGPLLRDLDGMSGPEQEAVREARAELLAGVTDEVSMQLRLLRAGEERRHHLSGRRLQEARSISSQLRELIGARGESLQGLDAYILSRLPASGFVKRPRAARGRGRSEPWANGELEVQVYPFHPPDPEVEVKAPVAGVILDTEWVAASRGVRGIGRMLLPSQPAVLGAAGLGEAQLSRLQLEKSRGGRVSIRACREVQLAGVRLSTAEEELQGAELHRAVASLVLEGRLFREVPEPLRDALHGWAVLAGYRGEELADYPCQAPPASLDPEDFLAARLATLGVETAADLQLLEPEDLLPQLEAETGVPAWVAAPLLEAFPRLLRSQGGIYLCTVHHGTRTVQLEPRDAKAKKLKEPPAQSLPRFMGYRISYQQGSRRLMLRG